MSTFLFRFFFCKSTEITLEGAAKVTYPPCLFQLLPWENVN